MNLRSERVARMRLFLLVATAAVCRPADAWSEDIADTLSSKNTVENRDPARGAILWKIGYPRTAVPIDSQGKEASSSERNDSAAVVNGDLGRRVDDFLTRMSGFGYSGNVLLIMADKVVLRKGYGLANQQHKTAYAPNAIFDIGSLAKTFTAAAVLKLETAGRLRVEDSIDRFLVNVPEDKRSITIHQLLTHTAGIISDFPYTDPSTQYEDVGRDEAIRRILAAPLAYAPGRDKEYSNGGYILLAGIIERASGQPFQTYVRDEIFTPLGLKDTGFWGDERLDRRRVAIGYNEYGEVQHDPLARSASTWQDLGGGQVLSTLDDLARWWEALANDKVLPRAAMLRLWKSWTPELSARDGDYGYGWFVQKTGRGTKLIQHGGDYLGNGAELESYQDEGVLLITSTNVRHDFYPTRNRTDRVIPKIVFGGDHPQPPAWVEDASLLRAAVGEYSLPSGGKLVVHEKNGRFFLGADGQDATDLLMPAAEDVCRKRAELTALGRRALDGFHTGDLKDFDAAAGGAKANPEFITAVRQELAGFGLGALRGVEALGTFPTGYPHGNPPDFNTTLLRLKFERGETFEAIRWANGVIASLEPPRFTLAADTQLQANGRGDLVGWNIVFNLEIKITPRRENARILSLTIHTPNADVVALRRGS